MSILMQQRGQHAANPLKHHNLLDSTRKVPRYSPSKIGSFCVPNFCPRCAWRLLRMRDRKPYNFPPAAVLNKLDAHQKQLARITLEDGSLPAFFGECADAIEVLDVPSLSWYHEDTDLHLYGKPDFLFRLPKNTYGIVDGKTADEKPEGHPLFYKYNFQLNFYAFLAPHHLSSSPYPVLD